MLPVIRWRMDNIRKRGQSNHAGYLQQAKTKRQPMTSLEFYQAAIEIAKENGIDWKSVSTMEVWHEYSWTFKILWRGKLHRTHLVEATSQKTALKRFKKALTK